MGSWFTALPLTLTQLNSLVSWEFCAHRYNSCQIFTTLPQTLLPSRSLTTCSPEVCPIAWAILLGILNTGHLLSSDRESTVFISTELSKKGKSAFTEEQHTLNLQQVIFQMAMSGGKNGEVQVLLPWNKVSEKCSDLPQLKDCWAGMSPLKLVTLKCK